MSQNTSSAVMAQRIEARDSLDFFPTPPWATRALCERIIPWLGTADMSVWEPACGEGDMARPLAEYFASVYASDVHDYGHGRRVDFLLDWEAAPQHRGGPVDWIITNPPFRLAEEFAQHAIAEARVGVALLVRTSFLETAGRLARLFGPTRPALILQFAERVPMFKGRLDRSGSTATAYCWVIWLVDVESRTLFDWLAPCRKALERPGDYPDPPAAEAPPAPLLERGV